jgi:hypothetical protein
MAGPSWIAATLAAVMILTALYCAGRLAASRLWHRATEVDADAVHVVMGTAMAGMLLPQLSPVPGSAWEAVFGAGAAWFAFQAIRGRRSSPAGGWRCSQPVPHLVESAAMIYMLAAVPGSPPAAPGQPMPMPGMTGGYTGAGSSLRAVAVVLAFFMVGYVLWAADQLASLSRATTAAPAPAAVAEPARLPVTSGAPAGAYTQDPVTAGARGAVLAGRDHHAGTPALAPRLAACYKIVMGLTMGYMLIIML